MYQIKQNIMKNFLIATSIIFFSAITTKAQITVTGGLTAQELAEILAGNNITVTNATLSGSNLASGSFDATGSGIGVSTGVILTSGNIADAPGPNDVGNSSTDLGEPGTAQMDALAGVNTHDAITLQFDFEVQSDMIQFEYVFASEEYPEYAPPNNSSYNDVFAFFISGPGITGEENIALVPGSTSPVAINNINAITNNQYYIDNTGGTAIQFDAFTTVLVAKREGLIPCQTYTLKLVIADAGDGIYNSAVFLQENSLIQGVVNVQTQTINADDIALEGCVDASFQFTLDQPSTTDTQIDFIIEGTATNGIDYNYIDNTMIIPAGQTSATIIIDAIQDGFAEGQETIMLIYQPEACAPNDTVYLYIDDAQPIEFDITETNLQCYNDFSGEINVNATGGFPPYTYHITDENNITTQYSNNPITGLAAGTYSVQVYDMYGCKAEALVVGGQFDAGTTFLPDGTGVSYTSVLNISGFAAGETIANLSQLQQICANMEHSYLGDLQIKIIAPSGESVILKQFNGGGSCDLGIPFASGPVDGSNSNLTDPGTGYDYCFNENPTYGTMVAESNNYTHTYPSSLGGGQTVTDNYLPAGSYTSFEPLSNLVGALKNGDWIMEVTDQYALDNGYIFYWNISLTSDLPDTIAILTEPQGMTVSNIISPANCGGNNGAIDITVSGLAPPFTYLWSTGDTTEDISGLTSGTYQLTVTDANNCTFTDSYVLNNYTSLNTNANITNINCNGQSNGAIDLTTSGGTSPYSFSWSNGETVEDINNLTAGNYTVTITDVNNCEIIETYSINQNSAITFSTVDLIDEVCGDGNGSIDISVSGGSGSYAYNWSNGATTQDLTGISGGTYSVTVTDGFGCVDSSQYTLINNVSNCSNYCYLAISNIIVAEDTCGNSVGSIDITITDATLPYNINWSTGSTTEDISGLSTGIYTVTVNDANGCEVVENINVSNNTGSLNVSTVQISDEICGNANGVVDITVSGGSMPYTYSWSNGATTEDIANIAAGTYTVNIVDGNNCLFTDSYVVDNNTGTLVATATITDETCNNSQGAIDLTVTGANGTVNVNWSNGMTTEDISGLTEGAYSCTITDNSGCSLIETYNITNNPGNLSVSSIVTNETCDDNNGDINLIVTGGDGNYSYNWSNGATTEDITNLNEGTYSCTIVDGNTCQVQTGSLYVFNTGGSLTVSTVLITDEICGNGLGAANIDVTGGTGTLSYIWSNNSTSQDLLNVPAGTYNLTVTDSLGCMAYHSVDINNTQGSLTHDNSIITNEVCGNGAGSINVSFSGGSLPYTYNWSNGATGANISGLSAGIYSCTVTDQNGCEIIISETVNNDASGMSVSSILTNEVCSNGQGEINITPSGGLSPYTFSWNSGQTTEDITGLSAGTYNCQITDQNGCIITTGDLIINNSANNLTVSEIVTNEICGNSSGSIDITISNGTLPYTVNWSSGQTTEDITGLSAGNYQYTVTDSNNCIISNTVDVLNNPGTLSLDNIIITNEMCGDNAGSIDITVSGGNPPYNFIWSNGATTEDITNIGTGTYSCTVTDQNGCEITTGEQSVANDPGTLSLTDVTVADENCGNGLGSINITVTGGVAPLNYLWNNGSVNEDIFGLSEGIYTCVVTDANGCELNVQATVQNDAGTLTVSNSIITDEACGNNMGAIDITVQGGTIPYAFSWSNGQFTEDISNLSAGNYSCQISDNNGCVTTYSGVVNNIGSNLTIAGTSIQDEICGNSMGSIDITVTGGVLPLTFSWNNGAISEDIYGLNQGNYSVTVTDVNGCNTNGTYSVDNNNGTLVLDPLLVTDENCGNGDGLIDLNYSGGNEPVSIIWSNGSTDEDPELLSAGTYIVTITDQYGCSLTDTAIVQNNSNGFAISDIVSVDENCGDAGGYIDITITGGTTPYVYNWSNGATTEDISGLSAGTYFCTITDSSACDIYLSDTIWNITTGITIDGVFTSDDNCNNNVGYVDIIVSGGNTPYTYLWNSGQTTEDIFNIGAGNYTCTITDNTGCIIISDTYIINNIDGNLSSTYISVGDTCGRYTGMIDLTSVGGFSPYNYNWSNGATTEDLSGLNAGTYTVTITDATGCEDISAIEIQNIFDPDLQFVSITVTDDSCGQGNGIIQFQTLVQGSYIYEIDGNPGTSPFPEFTGLYEGDYIISVIDQACRLDSLVSVGNIASFSVDSVVAVDENCGDATGSISISLNPVSGNYQFNWSNGLSTQNINNLSAGVYTCVITDDTGCQDNVTAEVVNNASFTATTTVTDENCGDGSGSVDIVVTGANGNVTYQWSNGDSLQSITGLSQGTYSCTITDSSVCSIVINETVYNNTGNMQVNASVYDDFCGESQGYIALDVSGSSGNISILWSNSQTTDTIYNLNAGNYTVTVTDNTTSCVFTETYTVGNNTLFSVTDVLTHASCINCNDGMIDITINGSSPGYTYVWSNGATTEDITDIVPGTYSVTITDTWGCSTTETYIVSYPSNTLVLTANITEDICNNSDGSISLDIAGGSGNYTIIWSTGDTSYYITGLSSGMYDVTVTDTVSGLNSVESYIVNNNGGTYSATTSVTSSSCSTCSDGSINLTVSGTGAYTYLWSTGDTTQSIVNQLPGVYFVTITDDYGCTIIVSDTIDFNTGFSSLEENNIFLSVYPNPSKGKVNIEYSFANEGDIWLDICNILGESIIEKKIVDKKGIIIINLNKNLPGVYFVKIKSKQNNLKIFKLILM